jgi:ABC-type multidrug transport system ATPase subunit
MVAVVGAPDAGITTFFDVLTNRQRGGIVSGEILINGKARDASFDRLVGYITKEDIHQPILTVKETLMFSAQLRADGYDRSKRALSARVDIVLKMLGLRGAANTIVGDGTIRGISGGEKRRTSIGVELVAGHPVIVADLPTNGLDSATAFDIMRTLKYQCQSGQSVIASLSQPSPELLNVRPVISSLCFVLSISVVSFAVGF